MSRSVMKDGTQGPKLLTAAALFALFTASAWATTEGIQFQSLQDLRGRPASVGFETQGYFDSAYPYQEKIFSSVSARGELRKKAPSGLVDLYGRAMGLVTLNHLEYSYLEVPELFVETSDTVRPLSIAIGRKIQDWNQLDRRWDLGVWQPRFRWDYLHPETVGLFGGFLGFKRDDLELTAFATPLFVPERGAPVSIQSGSVHSLSRWFHPPLIQTPVFGVDTRVSYQLDMPPIHQIVLKPSLSLQAKLSGGQGAWAAAGYGYQPINQIIMAHEGYLNLAKNPNEVDVTLHPRVLYHHVLGADVGYRGDVVSGTLSVLSEQPVRDSTPSNWTTQELAPAVAFSPTVDFKFGSFRSDEPTRLALSYLKVWGGDAPDQGPMADSSHPAFEPRYPFKTAAQALISTGLPGGLTASFRSIVDFDHASAVFSLGLRLRVWERFQVSVGADMMGVAEAAPTAKDFSFVDQFRHNDRVYGGVSYVF